MRQILTFLFIALIAGCHAGQNPIAGPKDTPRVAAKMTITAGKWGGGSGGPAVRRNKPRELVSTSSKPAGLTVSSESAGGLHSVNILVDTTYSKDGWLRTIHQHYLDPETNQKIPHGWYKRFYKTGELLTKGHYRAGKVHGVWVDYWRSGMVERLKTYSNGTRVGRHVDILTTE